MFNIKKLFKKQTEEEHKINTIIDGMLKLQKEIADILYKSTAPNRTKIKKLLAEIEIKLLEIEKLIQ